MKLSNVPVFDLEGKEIEKIDTGSVFTAPFRPDVIKRAVLASRRNRQIPYGVNERAGKRTSAESWGTGRGAARVPRVKGSRTHSASRAALIPFAVGGRRTHPPEGNQNFTEKVNKKEKKLAINSAITATADPVLVESRGHIIEEVQFLPLIVTNDIENLRKTSEVQAVFDNLGLSYDIAKAKRRNSQVRPGRGKSRGRKYKNGKSVLIVVENDNGIEIAARNLPGVDVVKVNQLNIEYLAPGTHVGRLTMWTKSAIEFLKKNQIN
ncbi:MAG: 50S ribosomal protein L4 [Candidatus Hodarchaeales archaeon]